MTATDTVHEYDIQKMLAQARMILKETRAEEAASSVRAGPDSDGPGVQNAATCTHTTRHEGYAHTNASARDEAPPRSPRGNEHLPEGLYGTEVIDARWAPYHNGFRVVLSMRLTNGVPITTFTHFPNDSRSLAAVHKRFSCICYAAGVDKDEAYEDSRILIGRSLGAQLYTQEYRERRYSDVRSFHRAPGVADSWHDFRGQAIRQHAQAGRE